MPTLTGTANPDILNGTALGDTLLGLAGDDALYGFDGDDRVEGGDGDDFLYGGLGNDRLIGGINDDFLFGGSGDDLLDGGAGEDIFYGQSGIDTVSYASALGALTLNLSFAPGSSGDAAGDTFLSVERFILGAQNDTLFGSGLADHVAGGAGDDLLLGTGGADSLFGDAGNDTLMGGVEGDVLTGGSGTDIASYADAGAGLTIDLAQPLLSNGDAAGDIYVGIEGLSLSAFDDFVRLDGAAIRLVNGDFGNDSLVGSAGADSLFGSDGNDQLVGGTGADLLDGGNDNDLLVGGLGADTFVGGTGFDIVSYTTTVRVNLADTALGLGEGNGDTFDGIEQLFFAGTGSTYVGGTTAIEVVLFGTSLTCIAGAGAETLRATAGALTVNYQNAASAVTLTSLGGTMFGGRAALGDQLIALDTLELSGFSDILDMTSSAGIRPLTLLAGNGNDRLTVSQDLASLIDGGGGRDTITGILRTGHVTGGAGVDTITLASTIAVFGGNVTVQGGGGNDAITLTDYLFNVVDGGGGNDVITVDGGTQLFVGGSFDISGGAGADTLDLTALNAFGTQVTLDGGDGDDVIRLTLVGSTGNLAFAVINGGLGDDDMATFDTLARDISTSFVFDAGWGDDTVTGFLDGTDLIQLHGTGATQLADLTISGDATQTLLTFGTDSILIDGLNIANFSAFDVVFS